MFEDISLRVMTEYQDDVTSTSSLTSGKKYKSYTLFLVSFTVLFDRKLHNIVYFTEQLLFSFTYNIKECAGLAVIRAITVRDLSCEPCSQAK